MSNVWEIEEEYKLFAKEHLELAKRTLRELTLIPAASHQEKERGMYCLNWLAQQGITDASIDEAGNVIWQYQPETQPKVLYTAHLDTVFSMEEPLEILEDGDIWRCPGITDDTVNVVLLLMAEKFLKEKQPTLDCGLILAQDTGEEGLGNLKGVRALVDTFEDQLGGMVAFDLYRDKMYPECIGSVRYRITAKTEGGHSFLNFGRKNAIAELSALVTDLYQMDSDEMVSGTHTTFNVGTIAGGTSVNTIAQDAEMLFEFRSDDHRSLEACEEYLTRVLAEHQKEDVEFTCEVVGKRPCAKEVSALEIQRMSRCCAGTLRAAAGVKPVLTQASTDCNIPLSRGIPAVCLGFVRGGGAHTREEWMDISTFESGLAGALALVCRMPVICREHEIVYRDSVTDKKEIEELRALMVLCDKDFVPPLSHRDSTSQTNWEAGAGEGDGISQYLEHVCGQHIVLWKEQGVVQAFMTWKDHFNCENLAAYPDSCYLTTMIVHPSLRGQGLSEILYELAEGDIARKFPGSRITLRTWSTNEAQDHILARIGYDLILRLKDDRGPGIDTVYFVKRQ